MMKRRKVSGMIMLSLIFDVVFARALSINASFVQGAQVPPQIGVKHDVHFSGIEVENDCSWHHNFTIQQNFFIKCENGDYFWIQNVYEVGYDSDPCSAIHVRQHWEVWDVPPGNEPSASGFFNSDEGWKTISGPPFDLELDSYITNTNLNMSGLQAGPGQAVVDVGPGAKIVTDPADKMIQNNWGAGGTNTRPQLALAGPPAYWINGAWQYIWGDLANWTQGTSGNVKSYPALRYEGDGTIHWEQIWDYHADWIGQGSNQTGEKSDHMKWYQDYWFGWFDFEYTPEDSSLSGIASACAFQGDVNGDGTVDIYDAIILANAYNRERGNAKWNVNADINGDGIVDIYDAILLANNYGKTA